MLKQLALLDFVIVPKLDLQFEAGMTVLSGETGAGKSILIDALSLCLGNRSDAGFVRAGCKQAQIVAVFVPNAACLLWLEQQSLPTDPDELHLRRVIDAEGRSKAYINSTLVPVSQLRELSTHLVEIHGQHAFAQLANPQEQLRLLDEYAQADNALQSVREAYSAFKAAKQALFDATQNQEQLQKQLEQLHWELEQLKTIQPKPGDWDSLNEQHQRLSHAHDLITGTHDAIHQLQGGAPGLISQIASLQRNISALATKDGRLNTVAKHLEDAEVLLKEAQYELSGYAKHAELDPEALPPLETQIALWLDTARKLKQTPEHLHDYHAAQTAKLAQLQGHVEVSKLERDVEQTQAAYDEQAQKLRIIRHNAAVRLAAAVTASMQTLNMTGGQFDIELTETKPSTLGSDAVLFKVAGHPGVATQSLTKVASGGELARISLAIAVHTVQHTHTPSLVFDEVDSGIGGAVADTVGRFLRQLSHTKQVLCLTHLPQVAACGHHHMRVQKVTEALQTRSEIVTLSMSERIDEIARMLGGRGISKTSQAAANELIQDATKDHTASG